MSEQEIITQEISKDELRKQKNREYQKKHQLKLKIEREEMKIKLTESSRENTERSDNVVSYIDEQSQPCEEIIEEVDEAIDEVDETIDEAEYQEFLNYKALTKKPIEKVVETTIEKPAEEGKISKLWTLILMSFAMPMFEYILGKFSGTSPQIETIKKNDLNITNSVINNLNPVLSQSQENMDGLELDFK